MNKRPPSKATTTEIRHREYAERFLKYFEDLVPNPGEAALDIQALPGDSQVLSRLAMKFCSFARALNEPVRGHWSKRRDQGKQFLGLLPRVRETADRFLCEHIWLETRTHVCGIRKDSADVTLSTLHQDMGELDQFIEITKHLQSRVLAICAKRKPRVDDDSNFYLFLMAAFLKHRGATIETAICQEIADYVNAHLDAEKKKHRPLERGDVRMRIQRFRDRNSAFAQRVEADVLGHVQRETGIMPITKSAEA